MSVSKFNELCSAYANAQTNFENFRSNCQEIASLMVTEIKKYLEIPEQRFSLYKINQNNEFQMVPSSLANALVLANDSYWHFGIGLTVCKADDSPQEELILIHLMVRMESDGQFFVKYANLKEEFEVFKDQSQSFIPFFDYIHGAIIGSYQERVQRFMEERTERKLGYLQ